jgi:hypothetical protein
MNYDDERGETVGELSWWPGFWWETQWWICFLSLCTETAAVRYQQKKTTALIRVPCASTLLCLSPLPLHYFTNTCPFYHTHNNTKQGHFRKYRKLETKTFSFDTWTWTKEKKRLCYGLGAQAKELLLFSPFQNNYNYSF